MSAKLGRKPTEETSMALMDNMEHNDADIASERPNFTQMNPAEQDLKRLPLDTQRQIQDLLLEGETLEYVEKPNRWRSTHNLLLQDHSNVKFAKAA